MRINEITDILNEGLVDTIKGLGAKAVSGLFGTRYVRDPATGQLVPNTVGQAAMDYEISRRVGKWAKGAISDFYQYITQSFKKKEPSDVEFQNALETWAKSYLPPSTWNFSKYSPDRQNTLNTALDQVVAQYQAKPPGQKLKQIQPELVKFITLWMAQTRDQERDQSDPRKVDFYSVGSAFRNRVNLQGAPFNARHNIYSTGNSDIDEFLQGMRFAIDTTSLAPSRSGSNPAVLNAIINDPQFKRNSTQVKAMLPRLASIQSTGDTVVDDFFRALGYTIT